MPDDAVPPMTGAMPEPPAPRKRAARLGLYGPAAALVALLAGWSAWWWAAKDGVERRADDAVSHLRRAGWSVQADGRRVDGWPFRLRMRYARLHVVAPSGWGVAAPHGEAEAAAYALDHWVVAAPDGLTLDRPGGGPVRVAGLVRASFAGLQSAPWRVVVEGSALRFTPAPGASPFPLAGAGLAQFYVRPARDGGGDGESLLRVEGLTASPASPLWRLIGDRPLQVRAEARLLRLARFSGAGWSQAARAWAAAGGAVSLQRLEAQGGAVRVRAVAAARLTFGAGGRLGGSAPLLVDEAPGGAESPVGAPGVTLPLSFSGGKTRLGPVRLGPSPKLF